MAGLWLKPTWGAVGVLTRDCVQETPLRGSCDWRRYEVTARVPARQEFAEDEWICVGLFLKGPGGVWIKDATLEQVGEKAEPSKP